MSEITYGIRITGEASSAKKAFEETGEAQKKLTGAERDNARASVEIERANESKVAGLNRLRLAAIAAGVAVVAMLRSTVNAAVEAERSVARLNAVFAATGGTSGLSRAQLEGLTQRIAGQTRFDDETIRDSIAVLSTFRQVSGDAFADTIRIASGLSEVLGTDLRGAVMQLGRALEDPVNGLDALRRAGVVFSDSQRDVIKNLVETGQSAEAQQLILSELKSKGFDVVAEAMNQGMGRATSQLKKDWNELLESIGQTSAFQKPVISFLDTVAESMNRFRKVIESGTWLERLRLILGTDLNLEFRPQGTPGPAIGGAPPDDRNSAEAARARGAAQQAQWQTDFENYQKFLQKLLDETDKATIAQAEAHDKMMSDAQAAASLEQRILSDQLTSTRESLERNQQLEELIENRTELLIKEGEAVKNLVDPWHAYGSEVDRLNRLYEAGVITIDDYGKAAALASETVGNSFEFVADTGSASFRELQSAVEGWGRELSRSIARGEAGFRSLTDIASRFGEELLAMQINKAIQPGLTSASSFLDTLFSGAGTSSAAFTGNAAPFHQGGIAGERAASRYIHPSYFENAPRLHRGGLAVNEVPAILERGEEVLARGDPRHRANGAGAGNVTVIVNNQSGQQLEAQASPVRVDASGAVVELVLRGLSTRAGAREQLGGLLRGPQNF